jgi:hypothetical protein
MRRWAIAVRHPDGDLRLFWRIRRPKREIFLVFVARQDYDREAGIAADLHTSWHKDGTVHHKSYNRKWVSTIGPVTERLEGAES